MRNPCKGCWWEEGGRCYLGNPERLSDGRSKVLALSVCESFCAKGRLMRSIIPGTRLVITSDQPPTKGER